MDQASFCGSQHFADETETESSVCSATLWTTPNVFCVFFVCVFDVKRCCGVFNVIRCVFSVDSWCDVQCIGCGGLRPRNTVGKTTTSAIPEEKLTYLRGRQELCNQLITTYLVVCCGWERALWQTDGRCWGFGNVFGCVVSDDIYIFCAPRRCSALLVEMVIYVYVFLRLKRWNTHFENICVEVFSIKCFRFDARIKQGPCRIPCTILLFKDALNYLGSVRWSIPLINIYSRTKYVPNHSALCAMFYFSTTKDSSLKNMHFEFDKYILSLRSKRDTTEKLTESICLLRNLRPNGPVRPKTPYRFRWINVMAY